MRLRWLILGIIITIGLFIFYPGLFHTLVSWVQSAINWITNLVKPQNITSKDVIV